MKPIIDQLFRAKGVLFAMLIFTWFLHSGTFLSAQPASDPSLAYNYSVSSDTIRYTIGGRILITQEWTFPKNAEVTDPELPDSFSGFEKISESEIKEEEANNIVRRYRVYTYTNFDSGYYVVPGHTWEYEKGKELKSNELFIQIDHAKLDTGDVIKPIEQPMDIPFTFKELLLISTPIILFVALIIWLVYYFKKRKKSKTIEAQPVQKRPAYVVAFESLELLKNEKYWERGEIKLYHTRLSEIIREYIEGRYKIRALESTTDELIILLESKVSKELTDNLLKALRLGDLAKFAKGNPLPDENLLCWEIMHRFVKETFNESQSKS